MSSAPIKPPLPRRPTRGHLVDGIDKAEMALADMIARWFDHIPAQIRAELLPIRTELLELLVWEKRR